MKWPIIQNKKTTFGGYSLIFAAILSALGKLMNGQMPEATTEGTMFITGIGLIMAKDGGH